MEPVKQQASQMPQAQSSSDDGQSLFLEPQSIPRRGVDSRDTVLQQCCECTDVIMLDLADDLQPASYQAAAERDTSTGPLASPSTTAQVVERRLIPSSILAPVKTNRPDLKSKNGSKKRLFSSMHAKETMYKSSGLPSPGSDQDLPQANDEPTANDIPDHSSLDLGNSDIHQDEHQSQDSAFETGEARELGMQLAHLVNEEAPAGSTSNSSLAQWTLAFDTAPSARDAIEAKGIARSQLLRANRKSNGTNWRAHSRSSPSPLCHRSLKESGQEVDTTYKVQKVRENQWEEQEERSADDIERVLDLAEMLRDEDRTSQKTSIPPGINTNKACAPRPNPYSRTAADRFRTQSRHLDNSDRNDDDTVFAKTMLASNNVPDILTPEEQKAREQRLIRMKMGAFVGRPTPTPKVKKNAAPGRPAKFHSPWDNEPPSKHMNSLKAPQNQTREAIREMMGTSRPGEAREKTTGDTARHEADSNSELNNERPTKRMLPSLSLLKQLSKRPHAATACNRATRKHLDRYASLPAQGEDLTLPRKFETFSGPRQVIIRKREILKERQKDLDVILEVYKEFARLMAIEDIRPHDSRQLEELKMFSEAVLDRDMSGKRARSRIRDVRDNIRRRIQTLNCPPDPDMFDKKLQEIMSQEHTAKLDGEMPALSAELSVAQAEANNLMHEAKNRYNQLWRGEKEITNGNPASKHKDSLSQLGKSERSQVTYYRSIDSQIEARQAQLRRFNVKDNSGVRPTSGDLEIVDSQDNESVISEEDAVNAVDEFMGPFGSTNKPTRPYGDGLSVEEASQLEGERQKEEAAKISVVRPTQAADMSLLQRMAAKVEQANHAISQGVQKHDSQILQNMRKKEAARTEQKRQQEETAVKAGTNENDLEVAQGDGIEVGLSHEFDDSDLEEENEEETDEEEDEDGQPICKRYVVKASIVGISPQHDEDEHLFGKFLSKKKATKKVLEIAPWVRTEFSRRNPDFDNGSFSITTRDGQGGYEQQMALGADENAGCRTWIEEEMYNPSEEAYENARVYKACQPHEVWYVDWERIIKPIQGDEDADRMDKQDNVQRSAELIAMSETEERQESAAADSDDAAASSRQIPTAFDMDEHQELAIAGIDGITESSAEPVTTHNGDKHQDSTERDTNAAAESPPVSSTADIDDDDDLFGSEPEPSTPPSTAPNTSPSPSSTFESTLSPAEKQVASEKDVITHPPPKFAEPLITRPNFTQLRLFSSVALANRHAKDVFINWYKQHLSGFHNLCYIGTQDEEMEEELKSIGDRSAWGRSDDFVIDAKGVEAEEIEGKKGKVNDSFRVWVSKAKVRRG